MDNIEEAYQSHLEDLANVKGPKLLDPPADPDEGKFDARDFCQLCGCDGGVLVSGVHIECV